MRKYLFKLLSFLFITYIILLAIDFTYSYLIGHSNHQSIEAWRDVADGNIQADVIIMGSSRAQVQIDPEIIDSILCTNSYNLGIDGSPINRQVQKYEIFKKRNAKPKIIIQNIDAWSLSYRIGYAKEQFCPYFWDNEMRKMFCQTEPFSFYEKYIPLNRYQDIDPSTCFHRTPHSLHKGYQGEDMDWDGTAYRKQKSIEFIANDTTLRLFDLYLSQTKKDSIKVVFVYAPLYYGATKKISNITEMYQTYQSIADKYEIPILDYSDMWICYDTTYFYNAMHLNKTGAEIFTDSLANDIKSLWYLESTKE